MCAAHRQATFEPGLADQACRKRHSTTEEALEVRRRKELPPSPGVSRSTCSPAQVLNPPPPASHSRVLCSAVQAAAKMGAYRTVLTHFSQRYPGLPQVGHLSQPRLPALPAMIQPPLRAAASASMPLEDG